MGRLRPIVWHPLVIAAWPVVTLYQDNFGEVPLREVLTGVAMASGTALVIHVLLTLLLRDSRRAGLLTSLLAVVILLWGAVTDQVGEPGWLVLAWLGGAAVLAVLILFARPVARELTIIASGMAVVVLVLAVVPILREAAPAIAALRNRPAATENFDELVGEWSADGEPRDIFYLVFDRYGSQASMEQRWGMDLDPFIDGLTERGFVVTPDSKANHLRTAQSLSSTLNMRYHLDLQRRYGPDTSNMLPIYELLQDHQVGRLLKDRGYTYAHIGAWWDPTQESPIADINYSYERQSDFELELFRSTLLSYFERRPTGLSAAEASRRKTYVGTFEQFTKLREFAQREGPTFTFAHILLPHEPFVFDRHGNYVSRDEEGSRTREQSYAEQTLFTNELITAALDDLLAVPAEQQPIVVVSADEGPHPVRFKADEENFDWTQATDAELTEKFAILNAYHLPGAPDAGLYDSISPVNTWRVIFNTYFGADLPLLEDRSYVFRDENHVYDFTEITDRLAAE